MARMPTNPPKQGLFPLAFGSKRRDILVPTTPATLWSPSSLARGHPVVSGGQLAGGKGGRRWVDGGTPGP